MNFFVSKGEAHNEKGKHCVEVARKVVEATTQRDADKAREDLKSL